MGIGKSKEDGEKALKDYLNGDGSLDKVWRAFDQDKNGIIDQAELKEIIYSALVYFCQYKSQKPDKISREQAEPYIRNVIKDLKKRIDKNRDGKIDRGEFEELGKYLKKEFAKLDQSGNGEAKRNA